MAVSATSSQETAENKYETAIEALQALKEHYRFFKCSLLDLHGVRQGVKESEPALGVIPMASTGVAAASKRPTPSKSNRKPV